MAVSVAIAPIGTIIYQSQVSKDDKMANMKETRRNRAKEAPVR
jgi:hypothetical protein